MKSYKNRFFMLLVLAVGIFDTKLTQTEPEELTTWSKIGEESEEPSKIAPSESWLKRFRESKINKELSRRVNNLVNRFKKQPEPQRTETSRPAGTELSFSNKSIEDFGVNPDEVTVRASDELPNESGWPKPIHDPNDWIDVTTEEDSNLKLTDSEPKFEEQRSSWKNIFKSDSDLLEKYLTNPDARDERLKEPAVSKALAKLSRTKIAELFTKITQNEIAEKRKNNPKSFDTPDKVEKLYIETFKKNESLFNEDGRLFKTLLKKEYILIPTRPKEIIANSLVNFKFEILDVSSYDPNLTIAENAERMKKSQNLSIQTDDNLTSYIRNYLQDHPTKENLKALLVNDFTTLNRTTNIETAQAQLEKILKPNGKPDTYYMENIFKDLTANDLANITKAQIKAQERINRTRRGAKVSYGEAKEIFQRNASIFQPFMDPDKILVPIESASKDASSFNFEIINISSYKKIIDPMFPNYVDDALLTNIAKELKLEEGLKLNTADIVQEIKNYYSEKLKSS